MRVTLALRGAGATRGQACLERRELHVRVRVGLAAEDAAGVNARVGAVEAEPDAASQRFDVGLGEARVGADRARRGAGGALVDARGERGDVGDEWTPMRSEDLFDAHVRSFGWMRSFQTIAAPGQMANDTATTPQPRWPRSRDRTRPQKPWLRPRARVAIRSNKTIRSVMVRATLVAHHAAALGVVQHVPCRRTGAAEVLVLGVQVVGALPTFDTNTALVHRVASAVTSKGRAPRCPWRARRARAPAR